MSHNLFINELAMSCSPESAHKHPGKVVYTVVHYPLGMHDSIHRTVSTGVEFPSERTIARLGKEYLGAEVEVEMLSRLEQLCITMPTGIKKEKRFTFLAALYLKSDFRYN